MMNLPKDLKELNAFAFELNCGKYSSVPDFAVPRTNYKDKTSNELTKAIVIDFKIRGGIAYRINTMGVYDGKRGQWRKGGMRKGIPDIIGIINGQFFGIEVKIGKDKQSADQRVIEVEINDAGGIYYIARNYKGYADFMNSLYI